MSPTPTNPEGDLERLVKAGFRVSLHSDVLVVEPVAYRRSDGGISTGKIVLPCAIGPGATGAPSTHQVWWDGEKPHREDGQVTRAYLGEEERTWSGGATSNHSFSHKPQSGYSSYYQAVRNYAKILADDAGVDWHPSTGPGELKVSGESQLQQRETGLARIGLSDLEAVYGTQRVAIIGAGGTGGYIMDLVAKCPVKSIQIYDDDVIEHHTGLRWPGSHPPSERDLGTSKSEYLARRYSEWHKHITGYAMRVNREKAGQIETQADVVFIAIDDGESRGEIVAGIDQRKTVIDCGVDISRNSAGLVGTSRVTRMGHETESVEAVRRRLPVAKHENEEYERNQQLAEMNALNACFAVLAWKESIGIYASWGAGEHRKFWTETNTMMNYDIGTKL